MIQWHHSSVWMSMFKNQVWGREHFPWNELSRLLDFGSHFPPDVLSGLHFPACSAASQKLSHWSMATTGDINDDIPTTGYRNVGWWLFELFLAGPYIETFSFSFLFSGLLVRFWALILLRPLKSFCLSKSCLPIQRLDDNVELIQNIS